METQIKLRASSKPAHTQDKWILFTTKGCLCKKKKKNKKKKKKFFFKKKKKKQKKKRKKFISQDTKVKAEPIQETVPTLVEYQFRVGKKIMEKKSLQHKL